eukprot:6193271-Pleurochrysis_carterae.AAC.4
MPPPQGDWVCCAAGICALCCGKAFAPDPAGDDASHEQSSRRARMLAIVSLQGAVRSCVSILLATGEKKISAVFINQISQLSTPHRQADAVSGGSMLYGESAAATREPRAWARPCQEYLPPSTSEAESPAIRIISLSLNFLLLHKGMA